MEKFLGIKNLEEEVMLWVVSKEGKCLPCICQLDGEPPEIQQRKAINSMGWYYIAIK